MAKRGGRRGAAEQNTGPCPCGTGQPYRDCCRPLHRRDREAGTAQELMRSRYSAFALADPGYLLHSWHPSTRPAELDLDPARRWIRLEVLAVERGGLLDSTGTVEFRAHHREAGRTQTLHERSRFSREQGRWVYLDALTD